MTRLLPGILAMAGIVLASNILVQFPLGPILTWGAFSYPIAFLVGDLVNRLQGPKAAGTVALAGFIIGIICSLIGTQIHGEYGALVTLRVAIASATGYFFGQITDILIFTKMRHRPWWQAPLVSTLFSASLDTILFFVIAFSAAMTFLEPSVDLSWAHEPSPLLGFGPQLPFWVSLAIGDWGVKLIMALVTLIPFRFIIARFSTKIA